MGASESESTTEIATRISEEIAGIHRQSYGEEVESVQTHIHHDSVVCILDITLLPHERTLLEHGRGEDGIRMLRREYQEAIAPSFAAAVERMTGRRVVGFICETHIDPSFSVEFFRLAPAA